MLPVAPGQVTSNTRFRGLRGASLIGSSLRGATAQLARNVTLLSLYLVSLCVSRSFLTFYSILDLVTLLNPSMPSTRSFELSSFYFIPEVVSTDVKANLPRICVAPIIHSPSAPNLEESRRLACVAVRTVTLFGRISHQVRIEQRPVQDAYQVALHRYR